MEPLLIWIGRLAGIAGVLLCVVAVLVRATGAWYVAGFQVGTLLEAGMAAMILACLAYLSLLAEGRVRGEPPRP